MTPAAGDEKTPLECPFCGSSNVKHFGYTPHPIIPRDGRDDFCQCQDCASDGPYGKDKAEAVERWNRRALRSSPSASSAHAENSDAGAMREAAAKVCDNLNELLTAKTVGFSEAVHACILLAEQIRALPVGKAEARAEPSLTFSAFRDANVARCVKWHPAGMDSWSPSDWLTAVTGELGELASLLKMRNRERDGLPGNKFSPTNKQIADELADVVTYLDLLAAVLGVDLGQAAAEKFNEVSERVGFPDRINLSAAHISARGGARQVAEGCVLVPRTWFCLSADIGSGLRVDPELAIKKAADDFEFWSIVSLELSEHAPTGRAAAEFMLPAPPAAQNERDELARKEGK